jgi:hypothetical protein
LQENCGKKIIKSQCNNVFCSYDKVKYNHDFYLYYDEDSKRWTNTLPSIHGNMKIYISGLYMGHSSDENNLYHAIQLSELDFELKSNNTTYSNNDEDDDDELYFGISSKSKESSLKSKRKYDFSSESSEISSSSPNITQDRKKQIKSVKTKTTAAEIDNQPVKLKQELSYDKLPTTRMTELTDNQPAIQSSQYPYYNPNLPPPPPLPPHANNNPYYPYYPYPTYNPLHPQTSDNKSVQFNLPQQTNSDELPNNNSKDKKNVQFVLLDDNLQQNDDIIEEETKPTRAKRGSKRGGKTKNTKTPTRKSPRKKGIMNIAVEKIIEIPSDDDDNQVDETQFNIKKEESFMDTESDYNTQNEEMPDVNSDNFSE